MTTAPVNTLTEYVVYSDGSCLGNGTDNAAAAWGAVCLNHQDNAYSIHWGGVTGEQTNNRAELSAVIGAIAELFDIADGPFCVTVRSDSQLICDAVNKKWLHDWYKNGWITKSKKPVENQDLWKELIEICRAVSSMGRKVIFEHVDGHSGDKYNEIADRIATKVSKRLQSVRAYTLETCASF